MLPGRQGEDRRGRPKPHIVLVEGLGAGDVPGDESERGGCTVHIVDVTYAAEGGAGEAAARKREKYRPLVEELRGDSWLGGRRCGDGGDRREGCAVPGRNRDPGQAWGRGVEGEGLMGKLHKHTVTALADIVRQRRRREHGKGQARAGVG